MDMRKLIQDRGVEGALLAIAPIIEEVLAAAKADLDEHGEVVAKVEEGEVDNG
jgi:hypothetical protein